MIEEIKQLAASYKEEVIGIRRHLHAHPERSFKEYNTSQYIKQQLDAWQIPYEDKIVETGIVATIEGQQADQKTIALRADMDALPIQEENKVPYASTCDGVMHACGHDVHTASVLGSVKILQSLRDRFSGTVKVIFQPGEEELPGGASLMIAEGMLDKHQPSHIFGQHVFPDLEAGKVGFRKGMYMASGDEIHLTVKGKGGHAALPHQNVDPVLIASHIIVGLQQLVSRRAKPGVPSVLSFGRVIANGATNVIPDEVTIKGSFRTMDDHWREEAHGHIRKLVEGVAESMGGSCECDIRRGYPCLENDEALTDRSIDWAKQFLGADQVVELDPRMTCEDFAYFSKEMPACFYRLGTRNESKGLTSNLHTSTFDVDEQSLELGMGLMAYLALQELAHHHSS